MPALASAREIFLAAIEQPTLVLRAAVVEAACSHAPGLKRAVEALLAAHDEPDPRLDQPVHAAGLRASHPAIVLTETDGTKVGPYLLRERLGEGGMGTVYVAEQTQPIRRKVALKIIKPGMDSRTVLQRFNAERQALALMDHPHIAKVFDAGTTEIGRPYFVMELVPGVSITEFCDQRQLSVHHRLELCIEVCHAIQHAHQKGIIHRDIKPSNVLVAQHDDKPQPKIIDFGIAKATGQQLTDETIHTSVSQMLGTPLYMSPEQADMNALDIDTRSDVYSLGVLLYELLTGSTPFDKGLFKSVGFDEMRRIIREEEPETVSVRLAKTRGRRGNASTGSLPERESAPLQVSATVTLSLSDMQARTTSLAGQANAPAVIRHPIATRLSELDWIVAKSLEKDRNRRYESPAALAADIERYLQDDPVLACPPSAIYRLQKIARRHRASLVTAATIAIALLLGATLATWQAIRATRANALATDRLIEVEEQRTKAQLHLDQAIEAGKLADQRRAEAERERALAETNFETALAGVDRLLAQVGTKKGSLPLPEASRRRLMTDALELYDKLVAQGGDSVKARQWAAKTSTRVASLWQGIGENKAARQASIRAISLREDLATKFPTLENRQAYAEAIRDAARNHFRVVKDFDQEADCFRRSIAVYDDLLRDAQTDAQRDQFRLDQLIDMNGLYIALRAAGKLDEAYSVNEQILQCTANDQGYKPRINALQAKGLALASTSPVEAEACFRLALSEGRMWFEKSQKTQVRRNEFAIILVNVSNFLMNREPEEARQLTVETCAVRRQLALDYPANTQYSNQYLSSVEVLANLLRKMAKDAESQSDSDVAGSDAGTRAEGVANTTSTSSEQRFDAAGARAEAESLLNDAASFRRKLLADNPKNTNQHALVDSLAAEARILRRTAAVTVKRDPDKAQEQLGAADAQFRRALAALRERVAISREPTHRERLIPLLREQALFLLDQATKRTYLWNPSTAQVQQAEAATLLQEAAELGQQLAVQTPDAKVRHAVAENLEDLARTGLKPAQETATAELRRLCQSFPADSTCRDHLCQALIHAGNSSAAIEEFGPLLDPQSKLSKSDQAGYYTLRAAAQKSLGKLKNAVEDYGQAIALDPENTSYIARRGHLHNEQKQYDLAIADFSKYLQLKESKAIYRARAKANFYAGNFTEAYEDIVASIDSTSPFFITDIYSNDIHACPNAVFRAAYWKLLDDLMQRKQPGESPFMTRAQLLFDLREWEAAISDCSRGIELYPDSTYLLTTRAPFYRAIRRYELAEADYSRALHIRSMPGVNYFRSYVRYKLGDFDGSLSDLDIAFNDKTVDLTKLISWPLSKMATAPRGIQERFVAHIERAFEANRSAAVTGLDRARVDAELGRPLVFLKKHAQQLQAGASSYRCMNFYESAMLSLRYGDLNLYQQTCRATVDRFTGESQPPDACFAPWACCLGPIAVDDYSPAIALARSLAENQPADHQLQQILGAILYRAGQFDEALSVLQTANVLIEDNKSPRAYTRYFLAMTHHALNQPDQAHLWLVRARRDAEPEFSDETSWQRHATLQLLHREASTLMANVPTIIEARTGEN